MKKTILSLCITLSLIITADSILAFSINQIIAYPVPFNPKKGDRLLYIGYRGKTTVTPGTLKVKVDIYDINGDKVKHKTTNQTPVKWNGYNDKGNLVKPGLYIIKIDIEDLDTGQQRKKIIRILINY